MTWVPVLSVDSLAPLDTAALARCPSSRNAAIFGLVPYTCPTPNDGGAARRQAFQEALLVARREALASTARHLRNQSRCKEASLAMTELRAVTHDLLAMGDKT